MKTIKLSLAIIIIALVVGCKPETPTNTSKSYQIINNHDFISSNPMEYLDGTLYEVIVFQYHEEDIIQQDNIEYISRGGGKSPVIRAHDLCDKVVLSFKILPLGSPYYHTIGNRRKYVVSRFYLTPGETTIITYESHTLLQDTL